MSLNVVFAGTAPFAVPSLYALLEAGHAVRAAYTQPDRPAGRGRKLSPSAVKVAALAAGIKVLQPASLRQAEAATQLAAFGPDLLVVVAYGLILPTALLAVPRLGALNVHGSLLPRWRGAAPVERALLAGDAQTGVCIMQMDAGLDTGPVFLERREPIRPDDTGGSLRERLAQFGAAGLVQVLAGLEAGGMVARPQPVDGACYAAKIDKREAQLDWAQAAQVLDRKVRAFAPAPLAWTVWRGQRLRTGSARLGSGTGPAGQVLAVGAAGVEVACGTGSLCLTALQPEGGRMLSAREFLAGRRISSGEYLESPAAG
ncbi:MAG: methionyl-tRNA formyltransferase [Immundisolibacter sp.]|uniref:methionyl-tRNA formyltransferase n=1 Tax=Immundisolibacter sp. TaxID=1934948 RepID=UPI003EE1DF9E